MYSQSKDAKGLVSKRYIKNPIDIQCKKHLDE